jgi:hypothetical protein
MIPYGSNKTRNRSQGDFTDGKNFHPPRFNSVIPSKAYGGK